MTLYLTGIGAVDHPVATGSATQSLPLSRPTASVSVTIGAQPVTPYFVGLTPGFVALAQANLPIPSLAPGTYPVIVTVNGAASNAAMLTIGK